MASRAHDERLKKRLQAELSRRSKRAFDPAAILFPHQRAVFDDPTPDRVLEGTRQLGKSWLAAVALTAVGLERPGSESAFLDFDKEHAEKIVLRDFETLLELYDVPARLVNERLEFDNGAIVYVFSGRPSEVKKLQGLKLALLVADECNDAEALEEIVKMVRPALMRHRGRILAMGIPGRVAGIGYWWEITHGKMAGGWGQHRGHMRDNAALAPAAVAEQRAKAVEELGADSPDFLRHWDGVWPALDNALRVYRYFPDVNGFDGDAPEYGRYSLGLDPGGVQDAEAAVVVGHTPGAGTAHVVDEDVTDKLKGGNWSDTEVRLEALIDRWKPLDLFYDYGSAKKALALTVDGDRRVGLEPVPMKDLDVEIPRVNKLFAKRQLFVRRGSRLEQDLLYTTWDAKARAAGKNKYSSTWKQNSCDALRAALWAVEGFADPPPEAEDPSARRQREIRDSIEAASAQDYSQLVDPGIQPDPDPWG